MTTRWGRVLAGTVLVAGVLSACATRPVDPGTTAAPPTAPSTSAAALDLTYQRSGGFAGQEVRLSIADGRDVRVDLSPSGARAEFALTPAEQAELAETVAAAHLEQIAGEHLTPGAADMYEYTVTTGGVSVTVDDGTLPSQLQPLLTLLNGYTGRATVAASG